MNCFVDILRAALQVMAADILDCVALVPPEPVLYYELAGLDLHILVVVPAHLSIGCSHSFSHSFGIVCMAHLNPCLSAQSVYRVLLPFVMGLLY